MVSKLVYFGWSELELVSRGHTSGTMILKSPVFGAL